MMKFQTSVKWLIVSFLAVLLLFSSLFSFTDSNPTSFAATDENNVGGGSGNPVGGATAGKASYSSVNTMWKISVYVAKKDTVTNSSAYTLTKDYYKFGYTFWLYRDGYAIDNMSSDVLSRLYLELNNKEEYVNQNADFTQARYSSVSNRVFKGSSYNLTGQQNQVPIINNFGTNDLTDTKRFFEGNYTVSNAIVNLAARAAGKTPEQILSGLTFTINGETKSNWALNMVDVRRTNGTHTSCVSWVFLYEPVVIINGTNITGYYHGVTATGVAAAMKQGIYNWTSSTNDFNARFKAGETRPTAPSVAWGLGTDFPMVNLPNSAFLEADWLGYRSGSYWQNEYNGGARTWYVESQFRGGGFGLRYQRAELPTVVIQKTVDGKTTGNLAGFTFTVTNNSTKESWTSTTTSTGKVTLYLPPGTYTITEKTYSGYQPFTPQTFVIPANATQTTTINVTVNNETIKTGKMTITKVADDKDYSGTSFRITGPDGVNFSIPASGSNGSYTYASGKDPIKYTYQTITPASGTPYVLITLDNCPLGSYTVTETRPARYDLTYVRVNNGTRSESLTTTASITVNSSPNIRFENYASALATGVFVLSKYSEDEKYDDTYFRITSEDGSIDFIFPITERVYEYKYSDDRYPITIYSDSITTANHPFDTAEAIRYRYLSFYNIPSGIYTVTEIRPDRYSKTLVSINDGAQTESTVTITEVARSSSEIIRFENYLVRLGNLEIIKTSTDGQVAGVSFTVTGPDGYSETFTTDAFGRIFIEGLPEGEYTISENGNESVYYVPEDQTVTIVANETTQAAFENVNRRTITVRYFDKYTGQEIAQQYFVEDRHGAAYDMTLQTQLFIYGYDFIDRVEGDAITGILDCDKLIDVYYGYYHTITVNYYDKYTGEMILDSYEIKQEHNTIYDVAARRLDQIAANGIAYKLDSTDGDAFAGTLDEDKVINLYYIYDQEITLIKRIRIDEIVYAHGTPTFFITLTDESGKTYTRTYVFTEEYLEGYLAENPGAEYVEMAFCFEEMPAGNYTVTEGVVMRYVLAENGLVFREGTGTVSAGTASFTLSADNKAVTVAYTNEKIDQSGTSHNDIIVNLFPAPAAENSFAGEPGVTVDESPAETDVSGLETDAVSALLPERVKYVMKKEEVRIHA